jgi:hypothetical protein
MPREISGNLPMTEATGVIRFGEKPASNNDGEPDLDDFHQSVPWLMPE